MCVLPDQQADGLHRTAPRLGSPRDSKTKFAFAAHSPGHSPPFPSDRLHATPFQLPPRATATVPSRPANRIAAAARFVETSRMNVATSPARCSFRFAIALFLAFLVGSAI